MSFDFGQPFRDAAGDGQLYNSEQLAPQEFYNCTWEALRQTARAYGFTGYDDAELRAVANRILARGDYNYGERWETNLAVAEELWPALSALMSVEYPNDIVAAVKAHGEAGRRVHCGFWCDMDAWVPPKGAITYSHALMSLAGDGGGVWWVNPEPHPNVYLSDNTMRNLYDGGGILVFEAVPAAIPSQEDVMPKETIQARATAPQDLCDVNTGAVAAFVVTRETAGGRATGIHVLVGYDGAPITSHSYDVSGGRADIWGVPDGKVGVLVWQAGATGSAFVNVKFGTK